MRLILLLENRTATQPPTRIQFEKSLQHIRNRLIGRLCMCSAARCGWIRRVFSSLSASLNNYFAKNACRLSKKKKETKKKQKHSGRLLFDYRNATPSHTAASQYAAQFDKFDSDAFMHRFIHSLNEHVSHNQRMIRPRQMVTREQLEIRRPRSPEGK